MLFRSVVDDELAQWLGCVAGYPWWEIHTRRQHESGDAVVASSLIWVPDNFADAVAELEHTAEPLFMLIERLHRCTFAEIRQTILMANAEPKEAEDLSIYPGTPVMCMERRFTDERGGLLEISRTVHPASSFSYGATLRRVVGV